MQEDGAKVATEKAKTVQTGIVVGNQSNTFNKYVLFLFFVVTVAAAVVTMMPLKEN